MLFVLIDYEFAEQYDLIELPSLRYILRIWGWGSVHMQHTSYVILSV